MATRAELQASAGGTERDGKPAERRRLGSEDGDAVPGRTLLTGWGAVDGGWGERLADTLQMEPEMEGSHRQDGGYFFARALLAASRNGCLKCSRMEFRNQNGRV